MTFALAPDRSPAPSAATSLAVALNHGVGTVLAGRHEQIEVATACVLAGGHVLIEDIPGVGKTLLAQTIAAAIGGSFARVQGSADLLPADVVGSLAPTADGFGLHFRPGPVFANVVLFDELNRANPRTQSALLEVMEEGRVTVDGHTHPVPSPFVVMATQNPVEMAGTYALAEGVTDRFMAAISLGRASAAEEVEVLTGRRGRGRLAQVQQVTTPIDLAACREAVQHVHLADAVAQYAVELLHATRSHPRVRLGASTRAGVAMIALARSFAVMGGRDHVAPHDIARAAECALPHRLVLAARERGAAAEVVHECLAQVPAPRR
ncbi:MAG: MoxR family ATPase [Actinomycetota bacterium]|nr:MoxR family ATPase [Actinomycetota bacterium]